MTSDRAVEPVRSSRAALTITERLQNNAIIWIRSLPAAELGPSRRIVEDLEGLSCTSGLLFKEIVVDDAGDFLAAIGEIVELAKQGWRPVLHVDAHGSAETGLLLAPSGERVPWDGIVDALRAINVATENNLVCVFALCYGLHPYKQVSLSKPVPAYLFFAPEAKISVGTLESQTLAFYRAVHETQDITGAFATTLGQSMQMFHCQGLFAQALALYVRRYTRGRVRHQRREDVVTKLLRSRGLFHPNRSQLKAARAKVRKGLEPGQHIIDHFAPKFLIDRPVAFTYADLKSVAAGGIVAKTPAN